MRSAVFYNVDVLTCSALIHFHNPSLNGEKNVPLNVKYGVAFCFMILSSIVSPTSINCSDVFTCKLVFEAG